MSKAKVVIKRNKWRCGGNPANAKDIGEGETLLRNDEGFMCCLGFAAKQLGDLEDEDIHDLSDPSFKEIPYLSVNKELHVENTKLSDRAIAVNDDYRINAARREEKLIKIFAEGGVKLSFVNKYLRKDRKK